MPRGRADTQLMQKAQKYVAKLHVAVLKATNGRVAARMYGSPVLVLATKGRRSGGWRDTPLLYLDDEAGLAIVASNGGSARPPAWYLNLKSGPRGGVIVRGERYAVVAEEVFGEEKRRLWGRLVEMYPPYEDYQGRTDREIPVILLKRDERV